MQMHENKNAPSEIIWPHFGPVVPSKIWVQVRTSFGFKVGLVVEFTGDYLNFSIQNSSKF